MHAIWGQLVKAMASYKNIYDEIGQKVKNVLNALKVDQEWLRIFYHDFPQKVKNIHDEMKRKHHSHEKACKHANKMKKSD